MWILWELIQPFAGYLAIGLTALLSLWGKAKLDQRKGRIEERARRDAADAKANQEAHERINNADTGAGASDDERIKRLRDFAAKHGSRPPKAGGR